MRYNWLPTHLPSKCICGKAFSTDHALSCPTGGLPTIRHNELRDFTTNVMTEVCHDICIEPSLQPISGEALLYATSTTEDEVRLDIRAQGFWGNRHQRAFFDVRVFNPNNRAQVLPEAPSSLSIYTTGKKGRSRENMNRGSAKLSLAPSPPSSSQPLVA